MVKKIAVMTSGGDSPGMNSAIRAILRRGLDKGMEVFGIHEGFEGLVEGGKMIEPLDWHQGGGILHLGGTFLGTARSERFFKKEGRTNAALNLFKTGINALVVIGGDGSLTGALVLYNEWHELLEQLASEGRLTKEEIKNTPTLQVIGLPGSIDNDLYGTNMSIGTDTALRNIVVATDMLSSTAASHQRTFVVETMGRHCGYLALMTAMASGATWVLIPEKDMGIRWHQKMLQTLEQARHAGQRHQLVIIAEGARHTDCLPIKSSTIKDIISQKLQTDVRLTVPGHIQRGGSPSPFDRLLAIRLGVAAIDEIAVSKTNSIPKMAGLIANKIVFTPLEEVISKGEAIRNELENGNYKKALELRGSSFGNVLTLFKLMASPVVKKGKKIKGRIAILTGGPDAPGMNTAVGIATRLAIKLGYEVVGFKNGFNGILDSDFVPLDWMAVDGWINKPGSELGAARYKLIDPHNFDKIVLNLEKHKISALLCIGGVNAFQKACKLYKAFQKTETPDIPICCIPASIDNNLPLTDFSIGSDTALSNIVEAIDKIRDTAGSTNRAFLIEVMGAGCGFLALMSGLASGAEKAYLPEDGITIKELGDEVQKVIDGFKSGKRLVIQIVNENASTHYNTDFIRRVMEEEGKGQFEIKQSILGHFQRGGIPTPFDRIQACRMAAAGIQQLNLEIEINRAHATSVGLHGHEIAITPLQKIIELLDNGACTQSNWFLSLKDHAETLSKYSAILKTN